MTDNKNTYASKMNELTQAEWDEYKKSSRRSIFKSIRYDELSLRDKLALDYMQTLVGGVIRNSPEHWTEAYRRADSIIGFMTEN